MSLTPAERRLRRLKHPMQPIYMDDLGTYRFKPNKIIKYLQERGVIDLNAIALMFRNDPEDQTQLAQLIGYSVAGAGDLNYFDDKVWERADKVADRLATKRPR